MNVDELKKNLHDVIERYRDKAEFTGEVCRDVMARDCLQVVEELEAENERLKAELEHARSYKHTIKMRNRNLKTENERLKSAIKVMHTECDTCWKVQELRKTKHALWMAMAEKYKERAKRFKDMAQMYFNWACEDGYEYEQEAKCDRIVLQAEKLERKCLQKAKEFE